MSSLWSSLFWVVEQWSGTAQLAECGLNCHSKVAGSILLTVPSVVNPLIWLSLVIHHIRHLMLFMRPAGGATIKLNIGVCSLIHIGKVCLMLLGDSVLWEAEFKSRWGQVIQWDAGIHPSCLARDNIYLTQLLINHVTSHQFVIFYSLVTSSRPIFPELALVILIE